MSAAVPVALLLLQAQLQAAGPPADTARYFQQDIRYTIAARLDEPSGILTASARLIYRNNSPDTLREIYFHLYLNAFRPHSLFADDELRQQIQRFADLPDPYYAYERLRRVDINGVPVVGDYPGEPDSTVVRFALPEPLPPGDSLVADLAWEARLSAIPRRQGRRGRHYDFAQWYPKVAVYDAGGWAPHALRLQGELYGEFGTYDVTLDLLADQVIGATGVPLEGDPGWRRAATAPRGRKRVRFLAEHVHHFAWSVDPEYVHEEGRYGKTAIHVLYGPEDRESWGNGLAVQRAVRAMAWLDTIFGAYPYPQATLLHRIEGGGTEFPMLVMLGGAGESLIFHELGHLYTYGVLANNEWKEGWLDEGFTTFQTGWNFHRRGMGVPLASTQQLVLNLDLDGWSRPVVLPAEEYGEQQVYTRMVYTKGQLILEMLKYVLGEDVFRRGLREYYARWQLRHVTSEDLRRAMEDVSGQDLRWFFDEWLTRVPRVDYALRKVRRRRQPDGSWLTRIVVARRGDGIMPVDVAVPVGDTTLVLRTPGLADRETLEVASAVRPGRVNLDPDHQTFDWNYLNDRESRRWPVPMVPPWLFGNAEVRLGWSGSTPARRDRLVFNVMPVAWYSDAGGVTFGFQSRQNYMGRFSRNVEQTTWRTGPEATGFFDNDQYLAFRNPTWLQAPRRNTSLELWRLDGRAGARAGAAWDRSPHLSFGRRSSAGFDLGFMGVTRAAFLPADRWDDAATVELTGRASHEWREEDRSWTLRVAATGGGVVTGADRKPYFRGSGEVVLRRPLGGFELRSRVYAAGVAAAGDLPRQRRIFAAGADPYETFLNPFLRSRGAPLAGGDVHYQAPGGAGVRALLAGLAGQWIAAANVEVERTLLRRPARRLFSAVSVAAFADAAVGDSAAVGGTAHVGTVADFGLGLRAAHRVGPTSFVTRFDVPFLVTRPALAAGARPGDGRLRPRWVWSFEEAF